MIAEESPALVVSVPAGLVLAANDAFCEHTGYSEEQLIGQPLRVLQPPTVPTSLIAALQAQREGSGFSVHDVPLQLSSGEEQRATIRASPLYCETTGGVQGFSLLMIGYSAAKSGGDGTDAYVSPTMPAASVEGLRNVAPSVLRLLQICADDAVSVAGLNAHPNSTAQQQMASGVGLTTERPPAAAEPVRRHDSRHSGASANDGGGYGGGGGGGGGGSSEEEDEDSWGKYGQIPPPLPVNESSARSAWSVLCASVLQKSMFSNVLITRQRTPDEDAARQEASGRHASAAGQRPPPADPGHYIWHVSPGLEQLLGHPADVLLGRDVSALYDPTAPGPLPQIVVPSSPAGSAHGRSGSGGHSPGNCSPCASPEHRSGARGGSSPRGGSSLAGLAPMTDAMSVDDAGMGGTGQPPPHHHHHAGQQGARSRSHHLPQGDDQPGCAEHVACSACADASSSSSAAQAAAAGACAHGGNGGGGGGGGRFGGPPHSISSRPLPPAATSVAPPSAVAHEPAAMDTAGGGPMLPPSSSSSGGGGAPPPSSAAAAAASPPLGASTSASRQKELWEAVSAQRNCLIEVILPTADGGAPRFCLAYVLPLQCTGPRNSSVAIALLDVHRSLPYMQRHMEARGFGDCDLYTFVKFSLLNCLVTDPSVRTADPHRRNPIVFASAGFGVMCGCAPDEVLHRNCRFLQSPSFVASDSPIFPQPEAVQHMSAALDSRHESLTYLHNFRKDGTPFANLLFMTPILNRINDGVLFWIGVQHPLGEPPNALSAHNGLERQHGQRTRVAGEAEASLHAQLRACQQTLHSVQLQGLYGEYTAMAQRTALLIQAADGAVTTICRMCEHHVLADQMPSHTQYCKVVTQCKTLAMGSDSTLARQIVKLNAAASASAIFGSSSTPAALVVDLLRTYTLVLLHITASSTVVPVLENLPAELDRLVAAFVQPSTASLWADIRAAGQRKLAALQHAASWASELQQTIVHMPTSDPLSQGQTPCLQDFEMVREIQRGSHATVWLVRKRQTKDVFAMKVIDRKSGRLNRLHTERKVLFLCSSPFVVKTFFAFEDSDSLYLVMERLHQDCKHVLQASGAMGEHVALPVMADLLLALEHLHSVGIVHRDLKPENMLLTPSGRLKLADFGLSYIAQRGPGVGRPDEVAKDPSIVGTPFYMAPETIRGKSRGFEAAADWWSFGVIAYEFLLGFPPFQGAKVGEIYRAILSLAFAAPITNCAVSPEAADLISRILVPDPRRRLCGAAAVMSHPWFHRVDWHTQTHSAGHMHLQHQAAAAAAQHQQQQVQQHQHQQYQQQAQQQQPPQTHQQLHATNALGMAGGGPPSQSLHALAANGGSLRYPGAPVAPGFPGPGPPPVRGATATSSALPSPNGPVPTTGALERALSGASLGGVDRDAARSVQSLGMESVRSGASTQLELNLTTDSAETTSHLDNLMCLNESRGLLCGADEQQEQLGQHAAAQLS